MEQFTIDVERRTLPNEDREAVQKELEEVIWEACPEAKIEWHLFRPSMACAPGEKVVLSVKEGFKSIMGREVETVGLGIWTDAAIFQEAGIPTINIGAIGYGLHESVEWVDLDSVVANVQILVKSFIQVTLAFRARARARARAR